MADLPILFSPPMVRALVREIEQPGTGKTQTRRVITPHNFKLLGHDFKFHRPDAGSLASAFNGARDFRWIEGAFSWLAEPGGINSMAVAVQGRGKPIYAPGDRLYVREHWRASYCEDGHAPRDIPAGSVVEYLATDEGELNGKDRRGMHMPRWASRLTLYVTDVRVEQLQDISEEDARAEGAYVAKASRRVADDYETMAITGLWFPTARAWYADLWDQINGPGAWDANPWVAAYTFVPRLGNIDSLPAAIEAEA